MPCPHKRIRTIGIVLYPTSPDKPHRVCLSARCEDCQVEFEFAAMALNDERTELSAWITEKIPGRVQ